jgi:hypothetical protein
MMAGSREVQRQVLITHGVDLDRSLQPESQGAGPCGCAVLRRRAAAISGIDAHTLSKIVSRHRAAHAGCRIRADRGLSLPRVVPATERQDAGRKPYDIIPSYMAAMDVLIMPWNDSDWIKACNPIKLKEYLAVTSRRDDGFSGAGSLSRPGENGR